MFDADPSFLDPLLNPAIAEKWQELGPFKVSNIVDGFSSNNLGD